MNEWNDENENKKGRMNERTVGSKNSKHSRSFKMETKNIYSKEK